MQFVFQNLAWGFLLLAVPLLIHLINLLRYQRIEWAAMQFLLESYKRNRRWVWLKQALLLLSRMAVLGALVAMLAQWVSGARLLSLLGRTITHHYVLLDDSMSMGQSSRDGSAYSRALQGIAGMLDRAVQDGGSHQLTLIRFSRAASQTSTTTENSAAALADSAADILARTVIGKSEDLLSTLASQGTVDVDVDGQSALQMTQALITASTGNENAVVYYVSDFREKEWNQPSVLKSSLGNLEKLNAQIELLDCAESNVENISLVSLTPDDEVLAAGVPVLLRLTIKNQGQNEVRNTQVRITAYDFQSRDLNIAFDQASSGASTELPPLLIDRLGPGESTTRSVQVVFPESGSHVVSAVIGDDALSSDNRVSCVLSIASSQRLLIVDDSADRRAAVYLRSALSPGQVTRTGWQVDTQASSFLRDNQLETLQEYSVIILADVNSLDDRSIRNLQSFTDQGGGLAIFPGRNWIASDVTRISGLLSRRVSESDSSSKDALQSPLLPASLIGIRELTPAEVANDAIQSMQVEKHPIFEPLLNLSTSPFQFIRFLKYVEIAELDNENTRSSRSITPARTIASLGGKIPLIVDQAVGQGHVILFTTAIDPQWNTWAQDPSVVVVLLKMSGYLASFRREPTSQQVSSKTVFTFSPSDYLPDVELVTPGRDANSRQSIQLKGIAIDEQTMRVEWDPNAATEDADQARMLKAGIRELWLTSLARGREVINIATNAPATEGELQHTAKADLEERLEPLAFHYQTVSDSLEKNPFSSGSTQQNWLLGLLVILLIIEQALAYWASYHLPAKSNAASAPTGVAA